MYIVAYDVIKGTKIVSIDKATGVIKWEKSVKTASDLLVANNRIFTSTNYWINIYNATNGNLVKSINNHFDDITGMSVTIFDSTYYPARSPMVQ